jgi:hypothetical protein
MDAYTIEAYIVDKGTRDINIRTISILGCFFSYSSLNIQVLLAIESTLNRNNNKDKRIRLLFNKILKTL